MSKNAKTPALELTSPPCVASWPYLDVPDTKFVKPGQSPQYKIEMVLDPDDPAHVEYMKKIEDYYESCYTALVESGADIAQIDPRYGEGDLRATSPVKQQLDKDKKWTGMYIVRAKLNATVTTDKDSWTQAPKLYDAAAKPIKSLNVGGGSLVRVSGVFYPFNSPKPVGTGVTCRLKGVQVLKLVTGDGQTAEDMGFDAVEGGYEASTEEGFRDETPATSGESKDGNY